MIVYQSQIRVQCACHLIAILCHDLVVGIFLSPSHPDHKTSSREIIDFSFFDQLANFCPNFHLIVALPIFPLPWSVEDTGCGTAHQQPWPLHLCSRLGNSSYVMAINADSRSTSLKSLRLQDLLTFGYLCLSLVTFDYLWLPLVPFLTFGYLSLPFLTFPYLSLPFHGIFGCLNC